MDTMLWSAYVNLLGAGVVAATARAKVLTSVFGGTAAVSAADTLIQSEAAAMATQGGLAYTGRAAWYIPNSPYQTYQHT